MAQCCKQCFRRLKPVSLMEGLRSVWRRGGEWMFGDSSRLPERDEHIAIADSLMSELDFHLKELNHKVQQRERDERRLKTGVDYSWLIASTPKAYEIPQLERLELEELCLKLEVSECTKVIALFRDAISRDPRVEDLVRIMRSCVIQTLEQRPRPRAMSYTLTDWVTRRASSLASLRFKNTTRIEPSHINGDVDIEMQTQNQVRTSRAFSMPNFSSGRGDAPLCEEEQDPGAYPV